MYSVAFYGFICDLLPDPKVLKFDMHSTAEERGKNVLSQSQTIVTREDLLYFHLKKANFQNFYEIFFKIRIMEYVVINTTNFFEGNIV